MSQIKKVFSTVVGICLFCSSAFGMLGQSGAGKLDDLTCALELLGANLRGVAEDTSFATEQEARESTAELPNTHGEWVQFSDAIYSRGSYRSVDLLHGRTVAIIVREANPADIQRPYRRVVGLFLSSLRPGPDFWPGQEDGNDSFVVLNRGNLLRIPGHEVIAIYKNNGKSVAIVPQLTGNPIIDAVPSRAFTPADSSREGIEKALQDAQRALQYLPLLGYKKLVFNPDDKPKSVDEFLVGRILAGVCQLPTGGTVIFAGKITEAKARVTGIGWRGKPETYNTPTGWGVRVALDGSFGADHWLDFTWCKSLWIHDGSVAP